MVCNSSDLLLMALNEVAKNKDETFKIDSEEDNIIFNRYSENIVIVER